MQLCLFEEDCWRKHRYFSRFDAIFLWKTMVIYTSIFMDLINKNHEWHIYTLIATVISSADAPFDDCSKWPKTFYRFKSLKLFINFINNYYFPWCNCSGIRTHFWVRVQPFHNKGQTNNRYKCGYLPTRRHQIYTKEKKLATLSFVYCHWVRDDLTSRFKFLTVEFYHNMRRMTKQFNLP